MIPLIIKVVNWLTNNFKIVAVGFICLLIVTIFFLNRLLLKYNKELSRIINNVRALEEIVSNKETNNRVLLLTVEELNTSKDSLIQEIKQVQKKLKIKDKNLDQVQVINTEIKDTVQTVIKHKQVNFEEKLELNSLTTIIVSRKDSILMAKLDIKNQQIIFVEEKKEYRNKYKNGWSRFWNFDFKKIRTKKYQIENSNPLIKVTDTRIIEVSK